MVSVQGEHSAVQVRVKTSATCKLVREPLSPVVHNYAHWKIMFLRHRKLVSLIHLVKSWKSRPQMPYDEASPANLSGNLGS